MENQGAGAEQGLNSWSLSLPALPWLGAKSLRDGGVEIWDISLECTPHTIQTPTNHKDTNEWGGGTSVLL